MKRTIRLSAAGPQLVKDALGGKLMLTYVFFCVAHYILLVVSSVLQDAGLLWSLALILAYGFVAAESLILYQRKESRNLRHLAVFCLLGAIALFLLCLFLTAVIISLNMEYNAQTEEILQLWADADLSTGMPYMIVTVVSIGLTAASLLFLWLSLRMSADMLERKGAARNWYLPAAALTFLGFILSLSMFVLKPDDWVSMVVNAAQLASTACLGLLLAQASREYRAKLG